MKNATMILNFITSVILVSSLTVAADDWKRHRISCKQIDNELTADDFPVVTNKTEILFSHCNLCLLLNFTINQSVIDGLSIKGNGSTTKLKCADTSQGLQFSNVYNLHLENLHILNCGSISNNIPSLDITNCVNVTIKNVIIENGTSVVMANTGGIVDIENSTFQNNAIRQPEQNSPKNKTASSKHHKFHQRGGGMQILVGGGVQNSMIKIQNCNFFNNSAKNGGGLFIAIQLEAKNNTLHIKQTSFIKNECQKEGGGLQIAYITHDTTSEVTGNKILIQNSSFIRNKASDGGGTTFFSTKGSPVFAKNNIHFIDCNWMENYAKIGMAMTVALASGRLNKRMGFLPSLTFTNCTFSNHTQSTVNDRQTSVFSVTEFQLTFQKKTVFSQNNGTAIEATSSVLDFEENSINKFIDNHSFKGGALYLRGLTFIYAKKDSIFMFEGNSAHTNGGAFYIESYNRHSIYSSDSCFFQYKGDDKSKNVTLVFTDNIAGYKTSNSEFEGDPIFATSIAPCLAHCKHSLTNEYKPVSEALKCIGKISFSSPNRLISTEPNHFSHTMVQNKDDKMCEVFLNNTDKTIRLNEHYKKEEIPLNDKIVVIPGKSTEIPYKLIDELCNELVFHVMVHVLHTEQNSIKINSARSIVTENRIILYGNPGDEGEIQLSTLTINEKIQNIKVKMDDCPPGYIYNTDSKACLCSAETKEHRYREIQRCNSSQFRASITQGYWIGYLPQDTMVDSTKENRLAILICPKGFCNDSGTDWLLPNTSDTELLSSTVCKKNREGIVCSSCIRNHSVYYHSLSFECEPDKLCNLGWLFYILAEIIPLTIIFLLVTLFNISFTSGPLNSIIFFVQTLETFKLEAEDVIKIHPIIEQINYFNKFFYQAFSMNPFALKPLSFCLWKGASNLDVLAFKYVTIAYSLLLVMITIWVIKLCNFQAAKNIKHSIIHGLSAFLVMSYTECTRVTLSILTSGTMTIGPQSNKLHKNIVFYNGAFTFMGKEHLLYAVPAIFFLVTLVIIPPLLFFGYPLCYKLLALFRIEESKVVQITCKIIRLEKFKPFFDSIQGAFKDRYRFFAGLYFFYRLCALMIFSFTSTFSTHYAIIACLLPVILFLHAICRPYKKTWHNILDLGILLNLTTINMLTMYSYQLSTKFSSIQANNQITMVQSIQFILVLLPLVYLVFFIGYRMKTIFRHKSTETEQENSINEILEELDRRNDLNTSQTNTGNYHLLTMT